MDRSSDGELPNDAGDRWLSPTFVSFSTRRSGLLESLDYLTPFPSLVTELQLDLTEARALSGAAGHEDDVVIEFGQFMVTVITEDKPLTCCFEHRELPERLAADDAAQELAGVTRKLVTRSGPGDFGPLQRRARGGVRKLQRPHPVASVIGGPVS